MSKIVLHDDEVSDVVSFLNEENWPGVRLLEARDVAPVEECVLKRWEAEDKEEQRETEDKMFLALGWLGV